MAKCGNCQSTGVSVDHVRKCYASKYGNVTTLEHDATCAPHNREDVGGRVHRTNNRYEALCTGQMVRETTTVAAKPIDCDSCLVKMGRRPSNPQGAVDKFSDQHGNWIPRGATADAIDDMVDRTPSTPQQVGPDAWLKVNNLRKQVVEHLASKPSGQRLGFFAINVADGMGGAPVKFYRVKQATNGRVYLEAQASDEYHAVRTPASIEMVLRAILSNPAKAAELYVSSLGKCYRCGRTLTDETSRSIGMGPECRSKQ